MITAEQKQLRQKLIGASDAAAICGLDPWRTPADVWAEKRGLLNRETNEAMERGTWLEPSILNFAESRIGEFDRDVMIIEPNGIRCANLDGILRGRFHVEAKTSRQSEGWGDEGTDQIPTHYKVQIAEQFGVIDDSFPDEAPIEVCYVPCLIAMDLRLYVVERDDDLIAAVREACDRFAVDCLPSEVPPVGSYFSSEVAKAVRRQPDKVVNMQASLVAQWQKAKQAREAAEAIEEQAKGKVLAALEDAEAGKLEDGRWVTYFQQTSNRIDTDKLRQLHPAIAEQCTKQSSSRVLRIRNNWKD